MECFAGLPCRECGHHLHNCKLCKHLEDVTFLLCLKDTDMHTSIQGELNNIRDEIMKFKVGAPARVGLVAPNDVEVPAGGTGLDPSSTNFFQVGP